MAKRRTSIEGMDELIDLFNEVGKIATRDLTKAAKAGADPVLADARANAPVDKGNLRRGIKRKLEKAKTKLKRVYSIGFYGQDGKGSEFVKISKDGKRSFYPVSQEYGWIDESGKKHPGKRFLRDAIDKNREKITKIVLEKIGEGIDKLR